MRPIEIIHQAIWIIGRIRGIHCRSRGIKGLPHMIRNIPDHIGLNNVIDDPVLSGGYFLLRDVRIILQITPRSIPIERNG